jgi:hypothetical protein
LRIVTLDNPIAVKSYGQAIPTVAADCYQKQEGLRKKPPFVGFLIVFIILRKMIVTHRDPTIPCFPHRQYNFNTGQLAILGAPAAARFCASIWLASCSPA